MSNIQTHTTFGPLELLRAFEQMTPRERKYRFEFFTGLLAGALGQRSNFIDNEGAAWACDHLLKALNAPVPKDYMVTKKAAKVKRSGILLPIEHEPSRPLAEVIDKEISLMENFSFCAHTYFLSGDTYTCSRCGKVVSI